MSAISFVEFFRKNAPANLVTAMEAINCPYHNTTGCLGCIVLDALEGVSNGIKNLPLFVSVAHKAYNAMLEKEPIEVEIVEQEKTQSIENLNVKIEPFDEKPELIEPFDEKPELIARMREAEKGKYLCMGSVANNEWTTARDKLVGLTGVLVEKRIVSHGSNRIDYSRSDAGEITFDSERVALVVPKSIYNCESADEILVEIARLIEQKNSQ